MLTLKQQNYAYRAYQETVENDSFEFAKMQVYTNENISEIFKNISMNGKSILTINNSGDYFINLVLLGASYIDSFDINRNSCFITKLKIAALKTLTYNEYLNFFTKSENDNISIVETTEGIKSIDFNPLAFDYKTYLKIKVNLDDETSLYWDMIYEEYSFLGRNLRDSKILSTSSKFSAIKNNIYLENEERYLEARTKINEIDYNFYYRDIFNIHELEYKYDIIFLSDIYNYLENKDKYVDYVYNDLCKILNQNGNIYCSIPNKYEKEKLDYINIYG